MNNKTYIYKTVDGCDIRADVHKTPGTGIQPVILWLHGGALIDGTREAIKPKQLELYLKSGFTVVSADYRLAPEVKIDSIISDIKDVYDWIRKQGPELFNADPDRIAVIGHSAGGYLALIMGYCVTPKPRALVSFYGYGDIIGDWYSTPSAYHSQRPKVVKEDANKILSESPISETKPGQGRTDYYIYLRQNGLWPNEVAGFDPKLQPDKFKPYCPIQNITVDYPPTFLLHGDNDPGVPGEQSVLMDKKLAKAGVSHRLYLARGGRHGFDKGDRGVDWNELDRVFKMVVNFLSEHF